VALAHAAGSALKTGEDQPDARAFPDMPFICGEEVTFAMTNNFARTA